MEKKENVRERERRSNSKIFSERARKFLLQWMVVQLIWLKKETPGAPPDFPIDFAKQIL